MIIKKKETVNQIGTGFTLPEFILKSLEMKGLFRRDEIRLAKYGISPQMLELFEQNVAAIQTLPSDMEMETEKVIATEQKNQTGEELIMGLREIGFCAKQVYSADSADLKFYLPGRLTQLSDADLTFKVFHIASRAKKNIADFEEVGLTAEYCDNLISKIETFNNRYAAINDRILDRDKATEERWSKANEVYQQMMKICEVGKFIWETESEAYYNDYVVYPTSGSKSTVDNTAEDENQNTTPDGDIIPG